MKSDHHNKAVVHIATLLFITSFTLIVGCGGGGYTGGGASSSAMITADNAQPIASAVFGGRDRVKGTLRSKNDARKESVITTGEMTHQHVLQHLSDYRIELSGRADITDIPDVIEPGAISGQVLIAMSVDSATGTITITMTFTDYSDEVGEVLSGTVSIEGAEGLDGSSFTFTYSNFNFISAAESGSIDGQVNMVEDSTQAVVMMNITISNHTSGETTQLLDLTETIITQNGEDTLTMAGMVNLSSYGSVVVSTVTPLLMGVSGDPESGGPLLLSGADGTAIRLTPEGNNYVLIEADTTGDGVYDHVEPSMLWTDL